MNSATIAPKIKILHVRDSSGLFGAERVILTIGNNLPKERFHFHLLCLQGPQQLGEPLLDRAKSLGLPASALAVRGRLDLSAILRLRRFLKDNRIDLLHCHDFKANFYGWLAAWGLGIPKVVTAHGSTRDSLKKKAYLLFDELVNYRFFDRIIAVSEDLQEQLVRRHIPAAKILLIQNGLDFDLLRRETATTAAQAPLPLPADKTIFAVVGRLFPDKGHRFFLEAFARVREKFPDIGGLFVGEGPSANAIRQQINDLGLQDCVTLAGVRQDMQTIYDRIDFLVIPSMTEGLPYVLLEAMASRVPVIASTVGDIPRLLKDRISGHLCPPGDVSMLAARMQEALRSPEKAAAMAEHAFRTVSEKFACQEMLAKLEQVYLSLLTKE